MLGYYHVPTPCFNPVATATPRKFRHSVKMNVGTKLFGIAFKRVAANVGNLSMGCYALGVDFIIDRMGLPESAYPRNFQGDLRGKVSFKSNKADVQRCGSVGSRYALSHHTVPVMHGHASRPLPILCVG